MGEAEAAAAAAAVDARVDARAEGGSEGSGASPGSTCENRHASPHWHSPFLAHLRQMPREGEEPSEAARTASREPSGEAVAGAGGAEARPDVLTAATSLAALVASLAASASSRGVGSATSGFLASHCISADLHDETCAMNSRLLILWVTSGVRGHACDRWLRGTSRKYRW